jgi:membrane protein DedA with SNARE-associated domain
VLAAAISFLPFKVATIASGALGLAFLPFLLTSLIGRAIRFFLVAGLVYAFGEKIDRFIDRYFNILSIAAVLVIMLLAYWIGIS